MTASVIIPHHKNGETLPRTLESVRRAASGLDVEIVLVDDEVGHGLSWARNRGLERAKGDIVFFVDADDTVEEAFFAHPMAELERSGADFCIFEYEQAPLKRDYNLEGNAAIREALLRAFLGYSFDDVRRWNAGGCLAENREPGSVCRTAFRRDFIERYHIRFDENIFIYEDAPFFSECALYATRVAALREKLYNYLPNPNGIISTVTGSRKHWNYKFAALEMRKRLDALSGGEAWCYCEASAVFSALEMLRLWRSAGLGPAEALRDLRRYLADSRVKDALRRFPVSFSSHPLTAVAVGILRIFAKCS